MAAAIDTFGTLVPAVRALNLGVVLASRHDFLVACETPPEERPRSLPVNSFQSTLVVSGEKVRKGFFDVVQLL